MSPFTISFFVIMVFSLCSAASTPSLNHIALPKPSDVHQVGRSAAELIDRSRQQPFAPRSEPVKLMIDVFYPVSASHLSPKLRNYMPTEIARIEDGLLSQYGLNSPNGTFEKLGLYLADNSSSQERINYPLAVFMPAEGTTRLFYSQIASTIASQGYTVVTIDAPYDADVIQYPDGSLTTINETVWDETNLTALAQTAYTAIETRVADVSFVLDSLSNNTLAHKLIPNLAISGLNTSYVAMFGHSLGGATAFSILSADDRVKGGLNMDGGLYGPGLGSPIYRPFMLMGRTNHTRNDTTTDPFLTWKQAWPTLKGWKRDVIVADTLHYDFSDYPILFDTLKITPEKNSVRENLQIGPMKGVRALQIATSYVGAFLDFVFHGTHAAILDGPIPEFPEVTFEL